LETNCWGVARIKVIKAYMSAVCKRKLFLITDMSLACRNYNQVFANMYLFGCTH